MQLIFCDETGTSFTREESGLFRDGHFFIYGGLAVSELKYLELEKFIRHFYEMEFGGDSWIHNELHASDIFWGKGKYSNLSSKKRNALFNEIAQLIAKYQIPILVGFRSKEYFRGTSELNIIAQGISAFYRCVEHYLAKINQTGLIIADLTSNTIQSNKGYQNVISGNDLVGPKGGVKIDNVMKKVFYDMKKWKIDPKSKETNLVDPQFYYESNISFIIDNIHYVDSSNSPMNQLLDCVLFLLSRVLNKLLINGIDPRISRVQSYDLPLEHSSMSMLLQNVHFSHYDDKIQDFRFYDLNSEIVDILGPHPRYEVSEILDMFLSKYE